MRRPVTVNLDEQLLDAVRRAAADDGVPEEEVVEEALRRYFGLRGMALLDEIDERKAPPMGEASDEQAIALAIDELRAMRAERRHQRSA